MNLHAYIGDQNLYVDQTEQGWEWAVSHQRQDRQIRAGLARSLDLAKLAAAEAAEVAPETITWKLIGSDTPGGADS